MLDSCVGFMVVFDGNIVLVFMLLSVSLRIVVDVRYGLVDGLMIFIFMFLLYVLLVLFLMNCIVVFWFLVF